MNQAGVRVASNGSVVLAVWNDGRTGRTDVTACRITPDGTPLDPTGIVVRARTEVRDVFWNGATFVVVTGPGMTSPARESAISYVSPVGEVTEGDVLAPDTMIYAARMGGGTEARFLFLPQDGAAAYARVVDVHGNAMRAGDYHNRDTSSVLAASNGTGFLELLSSTPNPYTTPPTFVSYTLDRDGNVVRSGDPHVPASFVGAALITDGHGGYLLFGGYAGAEIAFIPLDGNGIATGPPQTIASSGPNGQGLGPVTATPVSDGFVATWFDYQGRAYISRNGGTPVIALEGWGDGGDTAYEPVNDLLFAAYDDIYTSSSTDLFVQKGSATPLVVTHAAPLQTNAAIAAGANGFLVAWTEEDPNEDAYVYVRRYAPDATPLEDVKVAASDSIHIDAIHQFKNISIASSGDVYLVTWQREYATYAQGRRMDARSGEWIDPKPFLTDLLAAASNGKDALALTLDPYPYWQSSGTSFRRISMTGTAAISDPVKLSDRSSESRPAIASNGTDYLAVWNECLAGCPLAEFAVNRLVAMRLRADGTRIDAAPFVLDPASYYWEDPAIAWNGKTYLVTWSTKTNAVAAAYVGSDGAVQQLGNVPALRAGTSMKIVAHGGEFLILTSMPFDSVSGSDELHVTRLDGSTTIIAARPSDAFGPIDGASDGVHLMLSYDRVDDEAGRVGRVFIDPRIFPTRKRAVR